MEKWQKYYLKFVAGAALNAGIFVSYRLYMHHLKNKLKYLNADTFRAVEAEPCLQLDFTHHKDRLNKFNFEVIDDDLGDKQCAFFNFKNVPIILHRLEGYPPYMYIVDVDLAGCYENHQIPTEIAHLFLEALGLKDIPVTWVSDTINEHVSYMADLNLTEVRIAAEKRREAYIQQQEAHTESLKENLEIISLDDYKPIHAYPIIELDFTRHEDSLELLKFEETEDDLDNISVANFKYCDVFVTIQRYHNAESLHYNVYVDIDARKKFGRPEDLVRDILRALNLRNIPVSWVNPQMTDVIEAMTKWDVNKKKSNVKKANKVTVRKKND
jgi:hypothetical protein